MPSAEIRLVLDTVTPRLTGWAERLKNEIANELENVGAQMQQMAQSIVPVRTGYLRSTIYYTVTADDMTLELGATAEYAAYVEYGTRFMSAEPYLRPAMDAFSDLTVALMTAVQNTWNNV
jgi:HK97 gp10 family phage protein